MTAHQTETVTYIELNREHEAVLVVIRNGGNVEFDHRGLDDDSYGVCQYQLEQAVQRHGIFVVQRP